MLLSIYGVFDDIYGVFDAMSSQDINLFPDNKQDCNLRVDSNPLLEKKLQELRINQKNPLIDFVDKHFNLKNNPNQKKQLSEAVKW